MTTRLGVTFASLSSLGIPAAIDIAQTAADLGYQQFWTAEATASESFALLGAVGASVPGLGALATGIIPIQVRTPTIAAMGAATLQALFPEKDILLGIGISTPVVAGRWHGATYTDRPLAHIREYLTLLRQCLSGETVDFKGDFYRVSKFRLGVRLGERKPKIIIAALNERMLRLAGELADGVLLNYLPARHVPWSLDQVRKGGGATVYAYVHACTGDPEDAREPARRDLYGYAVADGYQKMMTLAGYGDEMTELRARQAAGDRDGAPRAISQRMIDDINFVGDAHGVARHVQTYVDAGVEVPVIMAMPWGSDRHATTVATLVAASKLT